MKNRAEAALTPGKLVTFQKGQIWRVGDLNLMVSSVGKNLVHFKRYRTQPRGVQTELISKSDLQKHLETSEAVLISA
jgi:hypothetical protein